MPRRFQLLAMVAVLLAMPACASPATGSWTPVAEPPREEPIDRPHTSPDVLCSLEDAEMVSMVGTVLKPLPQVSDPGGATICRWSDGTDPGFSRFIQLAGMPSERIGDMIEATVAALEELGSTDPQVRQYEGRSWAARARSSA